ncbi:haloacid dehalogenase [Desulfonema ishimotonii]|uniref:Haloacid dehalogenase n=1 Tax=Desulfonema ishimotonii TaxID=45657 RepID=A0A401FT64_9BACT|nr:haloacid dehalogenase [Desulfonema ishimotonii]GBC60162.1 haloacid dehalogenase [Desulfonema ishimotonii]
MIDPASVAFDIDGVVADTMGLFIDIAQSQYGLTVQYEDITRYMLEDCLDIDAGIIREIIEKLLDGNHDSALRPIEDAPRVLERLGTDHGPLCFVTARPEAEPIRLWMNRMLPVGASRIDIVATGSFEAKSEILKEKGISWFVEDRLETCFLLKEAGISPILFRQPWNRSRHPFTEVSNWQALESLIAF